MSEKEYVKLSKALHVLDVVMSDDSIKHKGKAVRKRLLELPTEDIEKLKAEIDDLETKLAINKGAMRAYREECEKAHDEAVKDFSHFLIDKAKDGSIDVDELPDLVVEWRKHSQLTVSTVLSKKVPNIKDMNFYYKLGVLNKTHLLFVYEFADFEKMMQEAKRIDCEHGSDMDNCLFVIQSFKDNSYDFQKSCFSQINMPVKNIEGQIDKLAKEIMADFKKIEG